MRIRVRPDKRLKGISVGFSRAVRGVPDRAKSTRFFQPSTRVANQLDSTGVTFVWANRRAPKDGFSDPMLTVKKKRQLSPKPRQTSPTSFVLPRIKSLSRRRDVNLLPFRPCGRTSRRRFLTATRRPPIQSVFNLRLRIGSPASKCN